MLLVFRLTAQKLLLTAITSILIIIIIIIIIQNNCFNSVTQFLDKNI